MLFTSNRSKYKDAKLIVNVSGNQIEQVKEVKYLGLYLDQHLSFDTHIQKLCTKVNVRTKLLWRVRSFINLELECTLYRSLIEPHFLYCSFILEGIMQMNLSKFQIQQNCALWAVKCVNPFYSADMLRSELGFDCIDVLMRKAACKFAFKGFFDLGPPVLNNMFELLVSERNLRSNEQMLAITPKCRTKFGERNFRFRAVIHWYSLPVEIKMSQTPDRFKLNLKQYHWPG